MWAPIPLRVARAAPRWARDPKDLESELSKPLRRTDDLTPPDDGSGIGRWFHTFDFDNGAHIAGRDPTQAKLRALQLPPSLAGHSLIDVGTYDGFFAFQAAQRGAAVTANDHLVWNWPGDPSRANFDAVHEIVGCPCEVLDLDVGSLPSLGRTWDVVLFLGVLYHLQDPVGGLRDIRAITGHVAVLETIVDCLDVKGARAAFYSDLNGDASNHFGPNLAAVEAMAVRAGFSRVEFRSLWELNTVESFDRASNWSPLTSARAVLYLYP